MTRESDIVYTTYPYARTMQSTRNEDQTMSNPLLERLRYHVTGAIERGEAVAIVEVPAIKATSDRRADGWRPVLEFANGGRQCMASRYGTMEAAERAAAKCLRVRIEHPEGCVRDPRPNECQEL